MMNSYEEVEFSTENALDMSEYRACEFLECSFKGMNLSEFELAQTRFIDCSFEACNLSNILLRGPSFRNVSFKNCKLIGVNFSAISSLMGLSFEDCLMDYTVFQDLKLEASTFKNCSLKNADFSSSHLKSSDFTESNLEGTIFNNCNLEKADFRSAVNYYIDVSHTFIKGARFCVPEVLSLLDSFEIKIE